MNDETVSHYRILEKLGDGGMGVVFKAEDSRLGRTVALKFIRPELTGDEETRSRFVREARSVSALQHHNICTIHEIDRTPDGRMFICMDYYSGGTLKDRLATGALPLRETLEIAAQAAEGLAKAHAAGIVHRDVKPANLVITADGIVKILDFGLAKLTDRTRLTRIGTLAGTIAYMSPEQARGGDVASSSDVWSLGVVLYEMLTGQLPFAAPHEAAMLYAIGNEQHPSVTELRDAVPPDIAGIVDRCLAKDPQRRYGDAAGLARDLHAAISRLADGDRRTTVSRDRTAQASRGRARMWIPAAVAAAAALGLLLLGPWPFESARVPEPVPIAVISFENRTGDADLDYLQEVIPNLLITSLEQSKDLIVVTWERMHDLLRRAGWADVAMIDREAGFEACLMDDIDTVVLGSYTRAGDVFVTDVKILDVRSKELLKSASARGRGVGSILENQIDELGEEIARGAGLSERRIAAAAVRPVAAVTTRSLEAYQHYLRGKEAIDKRYWRDARGELERAVALDSTFALAWLEYGRVLGGLRDTSGSARAYEKAMELSARAPEKERLWIAYRHAETIESDPDKARDLLEEIIAKYPKEKEPLLRLGALHSSAHRYRAAEQALQAALALDPEFGEALNGLGYLYADMQDLERAIACLERYAAVNPDDANPLDSIGEMYFRMGDLERAIGLYRRALAVRPDFGCERSIAYIQLLEGEFGAAVETMRDFIRAAPSPGLRGAGHVLLAFYDVFGCRYGPANEALEMALREWTGTDYRWGVAGVLWMKAMVSRLMGDQAASREYLDQSYQVAIEVRFSEAWFEVTSDVARGLGELEEGRIDAARARLAGLGDKLARLAREDSTKVELARCITSFFEAEVLLAGGRIDDSISVARSITLPPLPAMTSADMFFYNMPVERDVLARAYVAKGALDEAIAVYERLVTFDPGSADRRLVFPLLHFRLADLYDRRGMTAEAVDRYGTFLEICDDAESVATETAAARRRLDALARE